MVAASNAAAKAGAPDPVKAVKRHLRNDRGVRVSETNRHFFGKKVFGPETRITGKVQLSPSGPAATNLTWWDVPAPRSAKKSDRYRVIRVGEDFYDAAKTHPGPVPDGKNWIRFPGNHKGLMGRDIALDASLQSINVYDLAVMKAVLKCSKRTPASGGFLYQGTMSYPRLSKVSKGAFVNPVSGKPIGAKSKGTVSWRLWADRTGLLKRLITVDTAGAGKAPLVKRSDTRYKNWGVPLVVTAPPADEVIDEADLLEYIREQNAGAPTDSGNS
ncbi:hypothetical protein Ssi02_59640 [Sinosporangium siamense]|uniref:Uncharacterized protein n=2 Tax=Sinosporangium siamense TaxID=1367973 RepID=A0A919V9T0_9ACTN|nr:hypothetical protein Ssi02_59640 [Sinosporangium siamense]